MCLCAAPSDLCLHYVTTGETTMIVEAALQPGAIVLAGKTRLLPLPLPRPSRGTMWSPEICHKITASFNVRIPQLGPLCLRPFVERWKRKVEFTQSKKHR